MDYFLNPKKTSYKDWVYFYKQKGDTRIFFLLSLNVAFDNLDEGVLIMRFLIRNVKHLGPHTAANPISISEPVENKSCTNCESTLHFKNCFLD